MKHVVIDAQTLQAALSGYTLMLKEITRRITSLEHKITDYKDSHRKRYRMSEKARQRVSEAQKKRWREYRKENRNA